MDTPGSNVSSDRTLRHLSGCADVKTGYEVIKLSFMLNSTEHEISTAHTN